MNAGKNINQITVLVRIMLVIKSTNLRNVNAGKKINQMKVLVRRMMIVKAIYLTNVKFWQNRTEIIKGQRKTLLQLRIVMMTRTQNPDMLKRKDVK